MRMANTGEDSRRMPARPSHTLDAIGSTTIDTKSPHAQPPSRLLRLLVLGVVALAAALAAGGPAYAAAPCWKTLINDWYDGRIDRVYRVGCYREALAHMPEDV